MPHPPVKKSTCLEYLTRKRQSPHSTRTTRPTERSEARLAYQSPQNLQVIALNILRALRTNLPTRPSFEVPGCGGAGRLPPSGRIIGLVTLGG